jgi:flagellar basal body P-ring formation protein FlgA
MSEDSLKRLLVTLVFLLLLLPAVAQAGKGVEGDVTDLVKGMYPDQEVRVVLGSVPLRLKEQTTVASVSFKKVPDASGDGVCLVILQGKNGLESSAYVPFKVLVKRRLYTAKRNIEKGDVLHLGDLSEKQTYLSGSSATYPDRIEDVTGRVAKKEIPAGEVVTRQVLEDRVVVSKGDVVSLTAESGQMLVQAKGTAMEKGRMGDTIRVKGTSGKEVLGRVVGSNSVAVEF